MANGDIKFDEITEERFMGFSPEHREWATHQALLSLCRTCHGRQLSCDQRYVRRKHIVYVAIFALGAFTVLGYKKDAIVGFIIEAAVKAAIAGVIQ